MFLLITAIILILYIYGTKSFNYWKERGVKYDRPLPYVGSIGKVFAHRQSISDYVTDLYRKNPDEKFVGFYIASGKGLVIRDLELIKYVLGTDFHSFYARGLSFDTDVIEPLLKNLFFADGDLWRLLRQRMTPAFTSGKLKAMFPLIIENTEKLKRMAAASAKNGTEVDVRDLMASYTTNFISACGFGIDTMSIENDRVLRDLGKRVFQPTARDGIISALKRIAPDMFKHLHMLAPEVENATFALVNGILKDRNFKPSGRNDFIDLLLELRAKGTIVGESLEMREVDGSPKAVNLELDELLMAAQVFVFFAAGFETSSSATSFLLHQLAFHPEVQKKCHDEIDEVLRRYDSKLCYDAVKEMKYLEMCFKEGLRMFPPLGFLVRKSVRQYTFPGTKVTIDKNINVVIPVHAIQTDEKIFKDPEEFRPERFHPNAEKINNYAYMPFGEGPRMCIGERLGAMQSIAGLAAFLSQFSVHPSKNTQRYPQTDPASFIVQNISGGLPLTLLMR